MVIIPNSVVWLITARCNLSCIHCYTSRFKGLGELSTNDALRLIQEIAEIGIRHVSISGGEPLIRKDLIHNKAKIQKIEEDAIKMMKGLGGIGGAITGK